MQYMAWLDVAAPLYSSFLCLAFMRQSIYISCIFFIDRVSWNVLIILNAFFLMANLLLQHIYCNYDKWTKISLYYWSLIKMKFADISFILSIVLFILVTLARDIWPDFLLWAQTITHFIICHCVNYLQPFYSSVTNISFFFLQMTGTLIWHCNSACYSFK